MSLVETEKLLAHLVDDELSLRKKAGSYKGSFSAVCSFLGYQTRGSAPTKFDTDLAYNLGATAAVLAANLSTASLKGAYMATLSGLEKTVEQWLPGGVPVTQLMSGNWQLYNITSVGSLPFIMHKRNVDLNGPLYQSLLTERSTWVVEDKYENPGPIQHGFDIPSVTISTGV